MDDFRRPWKDLGGSWSILDGRFRCSFGSSILVDCDEFCIILVDFGWFLLILSFWLILVDFGGFIFSDSSLLSHGRLCSSLFLP